MILMHALPISHPNENKENPYAQGIQVNTKRKYFKLKIPWITYF